MHLSELLIFGVYLSLSAFRSQVKMSDLLKVVACQIFENGEVPTCVTFCLLCLVIGKVVY